MSIQPNIRHNIITHGSRTQRAVSYQAKLLYILTLRAGRNTPYLIARDKTFKDPLQNGVTTVNVPAKTNTKNILCTKRLYSAIADIRE